MPASFLPEGGKREVLRFALNELQRILACISAAVIAAISALVLSYLQEPASVAFATTAVRI